MRLKVQYVPPESLTPATPRGRELGRRALLRLAQALDHNGFVVPLIARRKDRLLLDGHQRLRANALRTTPDALVPCIFLPSLSDDQTVALTVALNNPALQAHFNEKRLAKALTDLARTDMNVAKATGFAPQDLAELDDVVEILHPPADEHSPDDTDHSPVESDEPIETVVAVFEVERELFGVVKPRFDELIARYGLTCHMRMEDAQ